MKLKKKLIFKENAINQQLDRFPQANFKLFDLGVQPKDIIQRIQSNRELLKKIDWESRVVVLPDIFFLKPNTNRYMN